MTVRSKRFVSLTLVIAILMLCPFLDAKERRGARLKIVNKDGTRLEGELIAVKPESLILLSKDGRDLSADITGIDSVQLKTKSKFGWGLLIGGAAGVATGLIAGLAVKEKGEFLDDVYIYFSTPFFGLVGLAGGGLTGLLLSQPETIKIDGASETELAAAKEKLRKQARIPDFR